MIGSRRLVQLGACLSSVHYNMYQTTMASLLVPPTSVRGQDKLDYEAFKVTIEKIPSLVVPTKSLNNVRGKLKDCLLKFPRFKPVQTPDNKKEESIIYLDPRKLEKLTEDVKEAVSWNENFKESKVELSYENWPCDEVLRAVLPENIEVPTSYSIVGHIVHLNLKDEQLPYKNVIAQVFLDKVPTARTVVNKLDVIDNTFRNFAMEILVGEENTIVTVKENGFSYSFDFAKVYWNPRLCTEHTAIVNLLKSGDALYDVFCGVGPFAIPAAKKGVKVSANDLNPESCKWLMENIVKNKVKSNVIVYNRDGRDFIRDVVKKDLLERRENKISGSEVMTMNLPALAVEFLDVFCDWLNDDEADKICTNPPTVHVYCFIKAHKTENFRAIAKSLVEEHLGAPLSDGSLKNIHHVRNVAPNKEMMRVTFALTREILKKAKENEEPAKKKTKLTDDNENADVTGKEDGKEQIKG